MIAAAGLGVLVVLIVATNGAVLVWLAARLVDVWLVAPLPMALIPVLLVATCLLSLGAHTPHRSGPAGADLDGPQELVVHVVHHHIAEHYVRHAHVVHALIDVVGRTRPPATPRAALGRAWAALDDPPLVVPGQVVAPGPHAVRRPARSL